MELRAITRMAVRNTSAGMKSTRSPSSRRTRDRGRKMPSGYSRMLTTRKAAWWVTARKVFPPCINDCSPCPGFAMKWLSRRWARPATSVSLPGRGMRRTEDYNLPIFLLFPCFDIEMQYVFTDTQLRVQRNCGVVAVVRLHEDDIRAAFGGNRLECFDQCSCNPFPPVRG